jgi:hypothetical protein
VGKVFYFLLYRAVLESKKKKKKKNKNKNKNNKKHKKSTRERSVLKVACAHVRRSEGERERAKEKMPVSTRGKSQWKVAFYNLLKCLRLSLVIARWCSESNFPVAIVLRDSSNYPITNAAPYRLRGENSPRSVANVTSELSRVRCTAL